MSTEIRFDPDPWGTEDRGKGGSWAEQVLENSAFGEGGSGTGLSADFGTARASKSFILEAADVSALTDITVDPGAEHIVIDDIFVSSDVDATLDIYEDTSGILLFPFEITAGNTRQFTPRGKLFCPTAGEKAQIISSAADPVSALFIYHLETDPASGSTASGGTTAEVTGSLLFIEDTFPDMQALAVPATDTAACFIRGLATPGDGQGGLFLWDAVSVVADNAITVAKPSTLLAAAPGRWIKLV